MPIEFGSVDSLFWSFETDLLIALFVVSIYEIYEFTLFSGFFVVIESFSRLDSNVNCIRLTSKFKEKKSQNESNGNLIFIFVNWSPGHALIEFLRALDCGCEISQQLVKIIE